MQKVVMEWYSDRTGSKIFGFFIGSATTAYMKQMLLSHYVDENGDCFSNRIARINFQEIQSRDEKIKNLVKIMKKDKFVTSYKKGYNKFFLIPGGKNLEIENEDFKFDADTEKVNAKKLASAFIKFNEKRQANRLLVQKFIEGIAV